MDHEEDDGNPRESIYPGGRCGGFVMHAVMIGMAIAVRRRTAGAWIKSVEGNSLGHTEVVAQVVVAG